MYFTSLIVVSLFESKNRFWFIRNQHYRNGDNETATVHALCHQHLFRNQYITKSKPLGSGSVESGQKRTRRSHSPGIHCLSNRECWLRSWNLIEYFWSRFSEVRPTFGAGDVAAMFMPNPNVAGEVLDRLEGTRISKARLDCRIEEAFWLWICPSMMLAGC